MTKLTIEADDAVLGERSFNLEAEVTYHGESSAERTIRLTYIAEYNGRADAIKMSDADRLAFERDHSDWIEGVIDAELESREERADEARASARRVNAASRFLAASGVYLGR
jgi:hypothetical protein